MVDFAGISLAPEEIVEFLRQNLQLRSVCQQMIYQQIIEQAAIDRNLEVTPSEIQAEADRTRYEMRLESVTKTLEWLSEQLMTAEDWEAGIGDRLLAQKLRDTLFSQEVERVFVQSRLDFEQISLYRIRVPYQPLAQELFYEIEESEISFYEAAHLYDIDEQRRLRCGFDGRLHRWDLEPDLAAQLFGASIGEVLGPFAIDRSYDLLMVSEFLPAELTTETRNIILERLFQEWLESELNYFIHNQNFKAND
ncbi:MAG: peptidylprolyl isomerase [Microcoleus sp. SIO2G3]|nr:peptidylprolyl isomerase [Microcoleus sp. SIO2G3]